MRKGSTGRKILDIVLTVIVLVVGIAIYWSGGQLVIRIIGIPIPAWIFFPAVVLLLFSEIWGLVRKRDVGSDVEIEPDHQDVQE